MIDLLGATTESSARVFGCFFLGLALGAAFISKRIPHVKRPWRVLAALELGIALFTIPILFLPHWTDWIWPTLGFSRVLGWQGSFVKLILSGLVVIPPAFLMGMTLPVALRTITGTQESGNRHSIFLYAVNTLGGALGLALAIGFLLPASGVFGAILTLMGLNFFLSGVCFTRDCVSPVKQFQANTPMQPVSSIHGRGNVKSKKEHNPGIKLIPWLAMFSGAAILAIEVLSIQMIHLKVPLSFFPTAAILACVITVLGLSAALIPFLINRFKEPQLILPGCLALTGLAVVLTPVVFMNLRLGEAGLGLGNPFLNFMGNLCVVALLSVGPAVAIGGLIFPLCLACEADDTGSNKIGRVARLLALNGVGGLLGAECAYRILLPAVGVHVGMGLIGIAYGIVSFALLRTLKSAKSDHPMDQHFFEESSKLQLETTDPKPQPSL